MDSIRAGGTVKGPDLAEMARQRQTQRDQELEAARLESPEKYIQVMMRQNREDNDQRFATFQLQTQDATDKSVFANECARTPALAKISDEVETQLANLRRAGGNADRIFVAKFVLGDRALKAAQRVNGKQKKAADELRKNETARPGGRGRSDLGRQSDKGLTDAQKREQRLANIKL